MALILIGAVADFAEPAEEYSAADRILLVTFVFGEPRPKTLKL
jgi:hypothetical protein